MSEPMTKDEQRIMWKMIGCLVISAIAAGILTWGCDLYDALFTLSMLMFFFISGLSVVSEDRRKQRVKMGLRGVWRAKDVDELEERVKALEEKLKD